jgi:formate hydrogenlyase subunit 3/multisubunit Na+/H+ antiporter MnhD subunit
MGAGSSPRATPELEVVVKYVAMMVLGVVLFLVGLLWLFQGLGMTGGSGGMNGNKLWAVVGPMVAVIGIVLAAQGRRGRTRT